MHYATDSVILLQIQASCYRFRHSATDSGIFYKVMQSATGSGIIRKCEDERQRQRQGHAIDIRYRFRHIY